eukprot:m.27128 g.27128  ORF g.27128 m.27128 type:complete len:474 (+) comp13881_c0_seq2:280-1701(+)
MEAKSEEVISSKVLVELLGGVIGGAGLAVIGHPFDTIKVRCQVAGPGSLAAQKYQKIRRMGLRRGRVHAHGNNNSNINNNNNAFKKAPLRYSHMTPYYPTERMIHASSSGSGGGSTAAMSRLPAERLMFGNGTLFGCSSLPRSYKSASTLLVLQRPYSSHFADRLVFGNGTLGGNKALFPELSLAVQKQRLRLHQQLSAVADQQAVRGIMPSNMIFSGPLDCLKKTLHYEGVRGLFRGLSSPLAMTGVRFSVYFGANGISQRLVAASRGVHVTELALSEVTAAAMLVAPVYGVVLTPIDLVKTHLQVGTYRSVFECLRTTMATEGLRGFMRGYSATTMTRLVGLPCYSVTNEAMKRALSGPNRRPCDLTAPELVLAGGVGGLVFWTVNFPVDSIKTRIQASKTPQSIWQTARSMFLKEGGLKAFFRGYTPMALRALPANGVCFLGVEMTLRAFGCSDAQTLDAQPEPQELRNN